MNEQQRGEYNALVSQQTTYKKLVEEANERLNELIEVHINHPTIASEINKSMAENILDGYRSDLFFINSKLEAFLKDL